jgi:hypothetical protein
MSSFKNPEVLEIRARVKDSKHIVTKKDGKDLLVIRFVDGSNRIQTAMCSPKQAIRAFQLSEDATIESILKHLNTYSSVYCCVEVEKCLAGITGYADEKGKPVAHLNDALVLKGIERLSAEANTLNVVLDIAQDKGITINEDSFIRMLSARALPQINVED